MECAAARDDLHEPVAVEIRDGGDAAGVAAVGALADARAALPEEHACGVEHRASEDDLGPSVFVQIGEGGRAIVDGCAVRGAVWACASPEERAVRMKREDTVHACLRGRDDLGAAIAIEVACRDRGATVGLQRRICDAPEMCARVAAVGAQDAALPAVVAGEVRDDLGDAIPVEVDHDRR